MKQKFNTPLVILIAILGIAAIVFAFSYERQTQVIPDSSSGSEIVKLPATIFDTTKTVPGSRLQFSYPSQGFYSLGTEVIEPAKTNENQVRISIQPTAEYIPEKGSEFVTLSFLVRELQTNEKTLEDALSAMNPNSMDGQYAQMNGEYRTVNGQQYFIYQVTEDVTMWNALTVIGNELVTIRLSYTSSEGAESQAAYRNNDELFSEILSRLLIQ